MKRGETVREEREERRGRDRLRGDIEDERQRRDGDSESRGVGEGREIQSERRKEWEER